MPKTSDSLESAFELVAKLLELHDDNPFKIKSFSSAARTLDTLGSQAENLTEEEWKKVPGIGASHLKRILQFKQTGTFQELDELLKATPLGLLEVLTIRGLGAKKVRTLWKSLGIETVSELIYACEENRLVQLPGFGAKTQLNVKAAAEFILTSRGKMRLDKAEKALEELKVAAPEMPFIPVGEYRRHLPVINQLEVLVLDSMTSMTKIPDSSVRNEFGFAWISPSGVSIDAYWKVDKFQAYQQLMLTGPASFVQAIRVQDGQNEQEVLKQNEMPWLSPELRDSPEFYHQEEPKDLIDQTGFLGALHNHTDWSDGHHTLKEMAEAAINLGWHWLGIADHSQSAFYAQGLSSERLLAQFKEIDELNVKLQGQLTLFKGVESDILSDGALDYPDDVLEQCDYVVASVHSGLRMDQEKAMQRLLTAIQNPYTTILGHPTGRLLLGREGYPLDMEVILEACANHHVAVEINAHPYRLDLDWQHVALAQSLGVKIIINPDAHQTTALQDVRFGIGIGRKGALRKTNCLNYLKADLLLDWMKNK